MTARLFLTLSLLLIGALSQAAVLPNFGVASGTASGYDGSDLTNPVIFGGTTMPSAGPAYGECTNPNSASTCNACTAMTTFCASGPPFRCAERSIHPALVLNISMAVDTIPTNARAEARFDLQTGTTVTLADTSQTSFTANQPFSVKIAWRDLCAKAGLVNCQGPGTGAPTSFQIFVGLNDGTNLVPAASQKFTVKIDYQDPTTGPFPNISTPSAPSAELGFFNFSVLPGDQKIYVSSLARGAIGPTNSAGVRWQAMRIYFAQTPAPPAVPNFCIPILTTNFSDLLVTDKTNVPTTLSTRKVTGLQNDATYMFNIASVDEASIVSGFLLGSSVAADTTAAHSATPGQVVGLLDDKHCFIATAAFGSQMAPEVELLRKFRNQFLLSNHFGQKFVHAYNQFSPPIARFISQSDSLRAGVRFVLWPLIWFAEIAIQVGIIPALLMALIAWFVILSATRMLRRGSI